MNWKDWETFPCCKLLQSIFCVNNGNHEGKTHLAYATLVLKRICRCDTSPTLRALNITAIPVKLGTVRVGHFPRLLLKRWSNTMQLNGFPFTIVNTFRFQERIHLERINVAMTKLISQRQWTQPLNKGKTRKTKRLAYQPLPKKHFVATKNSRPPVASSLSLLSPSESYSFAVHLDFNSCPPFCEPEHCIACE